MTLIKICGITTPEALDAAREAGADMLGFVFYPPSPRNLPLEDAPYLTNKTPTTMENIGLFVDPSDNDIQKALEAADLDMIQLHGTETPQRVQQVKTLTGLPVIKAISVATKADIESALSYEKFADWLLFDAKPDPAKTDLPGGTGQSFDWTLLKDFYSLKPWMLSGGLDAGNIAEAISITSPKAVDVSSGVEETRGVKSAAKIKEFIAAVRQNG